MSRALGADEFQQAFTRNGRTLWVLAAAWIGREEAADLVQETAAVAWQRRATFVAGSDLRAWLSQIARHLAANWRRRRRAPGLEDASLHAAPLPSPVPWPFDADRCGLTDELARALAGLAEVARSCLLLHVILDHTFAEIGAMLDLSENTVASHVRRARAGLRATLVPQAERQPTEELR